MILILFLDDYIFAYFIRLQDSDTMLVQTTRRCLEILNKINSANYNFQIAGSFGEGAMVPRMYFKREPKLELDLDITVLVLSKSFFEYVVPTGKPGYVRLKEYLLSQEIFVQIINIYPYFTDPGLDVTDKLQEELNIEPAVSGICFDGFIRC